jgi:uncharacterized membrane protein (UPF0127 family)
MKLLPAALLAMMIALAPGAWAENSSCVPATPELERMATAQVRFPSREGAPVTFTVKLADDSTERAAGFQHICPEDVERTAIWFRFPTANHSAFHMFNVHAPLDIAFLDEAGTITEIQRMEPYSPLFPQPRLYSPRRPYRYALETAAGRLAALGIEPGMRAAIE